MQNVLSLNNFNLSYAGYNLILGNPSPTMYNVYTLESSGGVVSAIPNKGISGTEITLSNTAYTNYTFDSYSLTGATLKNVNQFDISNSDVYVEGNFTYHDPYNPLNLPPYTIRLLFTPQVTPHFDRGTATRLSQNPNVWDFTYENSNWDYIFENIDERSYLLEVRGANTTDVTSMIGLFGHCNSLSAVSAFDTSDVTNMRWMFHDCQKLSSVPLFDTHNVTNMANMFEGCWQLRSVPLYDTSNVTEMYAMFGTCYRLSSVPLFDTNNVEDMYRMFSGCSELKSVPLFDTSNVLSMTDMFYECSSLSSVPLFDTTNVTDMRDMFHRCYSLSSAPLFDTHNVREFSGMFYQCSSLSAVPLYDTTNAYNMNNMFSSAVNVKTGSLSLYQQASTQTTPPKYHTSTFKNCGINTTQGAAELAQIPSNWK